MKATTLVLGLALLGLPVACGGDDGGTSPTPDAAPSSGDLQFLDTCNPDDDQCADGLVCFTYNAKGPKCTRECTMDEMCEAPSPGCSMMGVCKAP